MVAVLASPPHFCSLIEAGILFALGSDGPLNPYLNIMFGAIHPARSSEALTVEQAVEAYTRGSARMPSFGSKKKARLRQGKLADPESLLHRWRNHKPAATRP
jgi:predicted amidohydrolase YtcJ